MTERMLDIGRPENLQFHDHGTHIEISRKWFGSEILVMTVFAIVWDGFMINWYGMALGSGNLITILFPIGHVLVGAGITYYVIAGWFNKTYILASLLEVGVRHSPVPWRGNIKIPSGDLRQLYVKNTTSWYNNNRSEIFEVRVISKSGENLKLVGGLKSQEQGIFIEQKIENYLNIKPEAVPGEV